MFFRNVSPRSESARNDPARVLFPITGLLALLWAGSAEASSYSLTVLGTLRSDTLGASYARGINNAGLVVGEAASDVTGDHVFRWTSSGGMTDAGMLVPPYLTTGLDVNSSGELCGFGLSQSNGFATAMHQVPGGDVLALPKSPGAGDSYAYGISDAGAVVGWTNLSSGCGGPACPGNPGHAIRWDGATTFLPDLGGFFSVATDISSDGAMVCGYGANGSGQIRGFRVHGLIVDELPPLAGFSESYASCITNSGDVVGYSQTSSQSRATLWVGTAALDLGLPGDAVSSAATGINGSGEIVGYSVLANAETRAVLFSATGPPQDLNALLASGTSYTLVYAKRISDAGQIVGDALRADSRRAMVLTPVPTAAVGREPVPARGLELRAPEPNPLFTRATLRYVLPRAGRTRLAVMDIAGREVARLLDRDEAAGEHSFAWDGSDSDGRLLESGVYFVRLQAFGALRSRRIVVAR